MDAELLDLIARTRPTLLEILEKRGYDVESVRSMAPADVAKLASHSMTGQASLIDFVVERIEGSSAPKQRCRVFYWTDTPTRIRIDRLVNEMIGEEAGVWSANPLEEEVLVILNEPFHDVFHQTAIQMWGNHKFIIAFFHIKNLISNPSSHTMVPPHRKLNAEESTAVLSRLHMRSKNEFPRILYHIDMQARVLGLVPGDLVEIHRPSPTSGDYVAYRVCTLG
jgi:DNA-directed RNA polymerase subunit H (RpoH/RPB5)